MSEKIKLTQAVIVEGRYDKSTLENIIDALIIPTHGFSIFTDEETKQFIRKIAEQRGIVVLTDSDAAGFKIRGFLRGLVPTEQITDVYIPEILGKEKRKTAPSKEGTLGVEGMSRKVLEHAFAQAGITTDKGKPRPPFLSKTDFYMDGFTGRENSSFLREELYQRLGLPRHLSVNEAVTLLNTLLTKEEYQALVEEISQR